MANESALFEDDFPLDFEEESAEALSPSEPGDADALDDLLIANEDELSTPSEMFDAPLAEPDVGERPIPAISVRVFHELPSTADLIETISLDRRMRRADVEGDCRWPLALRWNTCRPM